MLHGADVKRVGRRYDFASSVDAESKVAMSVISEAQTQFLNECRVGRLATVDRSGEAFVVPVCYAFDGHRIYTPIDEKPKRRDRPLKRIRNIRESRRATLTVDYYDDEDWSRLAWLMVRGPAEVIEPGHAWHENAVAALRARYAQYASMDLERAEVIVLHPERATSWGIVS